MADPLVKSDVKSWSKIQSVLEKDWPRSISGFYLLETQRRWIENGHGYGLAVYCPYGNEKSGIVVVNEKKEFYELIIISPLDDTTHLERALLSTAVLDWSKIRIAVPFAPKNVVECLTRVLPSLEKDFERLDCNSFLYEKSRPRFKIEVPPDFYISPLRQEHVSTVDIAWPHRYPTSPWYFSAIISTGSGYGVFLKLDDSLVSWVFIKEAGNLGHFFTAKEYRKKGLGELVLKYVSNVILEQGKDVYAFCVKENLKANSVFTKTGFEQFSDVTFCYIKPKVLMINNDANI